MSDESEEGEPARRERFARSPSAPTKEEKAAHEIHHTPFRSWCVHCVRGRAVASPHLTMARGKEEQVYPMIAMDYLHLGAKGEDTVPVLVAKDKMSGSILSMLVPGKGNAAPWIVKSAMDFIT